MNQGFEAVEADKRTGLEIAVIGMAGRFPGARTLDEFWENLIDGVECIYFFSDEEVQKDAISSELLENPDYVKVEGGILENREFFDASFFGYTPKEAELMDPQLRLFHECAWEVLESASYDPYTYNGLIGTYVSASPNYHWKSLAVLSGKAGELGDFASRFLTESDFISTKVAHKLNLRGPASNISTACSSSLVSIHMACRSLLIGECDMALAGGISVWGMRSSGYLYQEGMINSPDGHCRAFDTNARGTVGGEGLGVVMLKPLEEALEDRDYIYAVIKSSAINNDGTRKVGYTAPSIDGQAEVIRTAHRVGNVDPESITYIEAHGTGTELGDPVEVAALKLAFNSDKKGFCAIGSIKSNIGHLDYAAGAAGFIKTVLALKHRIILPSLHFEIPNPGIDFIDSPFYVNTTLLEWTDDKWPLRAGVSAFGLGGTNAHAILEEWPASRSLACQAGSPGENYQLISLSAKTSSALDRATGNLLEHLKNNPDINLADVAYSLQIGRKAFPHRRMMICSSPAEAIEILADPESGRILTARVKEEKQRVIQSIKPLTGAVTDTYYLLNQIGESWLSGAVFNWQEFYTGENRNRIPLPTYPFERKPFWIEGNPFRLGAERKLGESGQRKKSDIADWFYLPSWKRSTQLCPGRQKYSKTSCWLVFQDECNLGTELVNRLKQDDQVVIIVKPGLEFVGRNGREYKVNPGKNQDYDALFQDICTNGTPPRHIIHLWGVTGAGGSGNESDPNAVARVQDLGFYSLIYTAQTLGKRSVDNPIKITVITDNMQDVTGREDLCPGKATIMGAVKVIPQEYANITCRCIDLEPPEGGDWNNEHLIRQLLLEFAVEKPEAVVAYRGQHRWLPTYEPIRLENRAETGHDYKLARLRDKGVYLITGGLGGLGFELAKYLARRMQARLILTGSSAYPARGDWDRWLETHGVDDNISQKIRKVRELEQIGAQVRVFTADVANQEEMQKVINLSREQWGPINGVIHSAGLPDGVAIHLRTKETTHNILSPKVTGTLVLDRVLKDTTLDFFLMCSSLSSILAMFGQVGYCAANAFIDAFAHYKTSRGNIPAVAINWDVWNEVGMGVKTIDQIAADQPIQNANMLLANGISNSEGIEIFRRILDCPLLLDQVVISTTGLTIRLEEQSGANISRAAQEFKLEVYSGTLHPRPELSTDYVAPRTEFEKTFTNILKKFFGYDQVGIDDNFFEFGITSLTIIRLNSLLRENLNRKIPIVVMFEYSTIRSLGRYLEQEKKGEPGTDEETWELQEREKEQQLMRKTLDLFNQAN